MRPTFSLKTLFVLSERLDVFNDEAIKFLHNQYAEKL